MKVYVSRGSVAAGDDVNAPNARTFSFENGTSLPDMISHISRSGYLPSISGGQASWSVTSGVPLAIVAQQWSEPHMLSIAIPENRLDRDGDVLRLNFNYHAQVDPELLYEVFWGFRLYAI
jgi:hypothetical protein